MRITMVTAAMGIMAAVTVTVVVTVTVTDIIIDIRLNRSRLIKMPDRTLERPPHGGLSVCA
jgi:hypothetical protein